MVDVPQEHPQDSDCLSGRPWYVGCRRQTKVRNLPETQYRRGGGSDNCWPVRLFLARDSIYAIAPYMPPPVRMSVRLSVTRVDQSKTVEVTMTQSSPMTLVFWRLTSPWNSKGKMRSGGAEWHSGGKNTQVPANKSSYGISEMVQGETKVTISD